MLKCDQEKERKQLEWLSKRLGWKSPKDRPPSPPRQRASDEDLQKRNRRCRTALQRLFRLADLNRDGLVTAQELCVLREDLIQGPHREHWDEAISRAVAGSTDADHVEEEEFVESLLSLLAQLSEKQYERSLAAYAQLGEMFEAERERRIRVLKDLFELLADARSAALPDSGIERLGTVLAGINDTVPRDPRELLSKLDSDADGLVRETDFICYLDSVLSLKRARFDQEVKTVTNKAAPALEWSSIDEEAFATFNAIPAPRPREVVECISKMAARRPQGAWQDARLHDPASERAQMDEHGVRLCCFANKKSSSWGSSWKRKWVTLTDGMIHVFTSQAYNGALASKCFPVGKITQIKKSAKRPNAIKLTFSDGKRETFDFNSLQEHDEWLKTIKDIHQEVDEVKAKHRKDIESGAVGEADPD